MSEPAPPPPSPLQAKRRLPFDEAAPARHPGVTAAAILYGAAMLIAFGVAIFMATVQRQAFVSVPVLASIAIGFWFFIRMLMTLRPPRPRD